MIGDGVWVYTYDYQGNLIGKTDGATTWTYEYNLWNRMVKAYRKAGGETEPALIAENRYGPLGRRLFKRDDAHRDGVCYEYLGHNII